MSERRLRLVDTETGVLVDEQPSIQALSAALAKAQQENNALRQLLREANKESGELDPADDVRTVFEHWQTACSHPSAKLGPKRATLVRKAIGWGYTVKDLCRAVDGKALYPFVVDGRYCQTGRREDRYDDLEHCIGSEKRIDKLMALAESSETSDTLRTQASEPQTPRRSGERDLERFRDPWVRPVDMFLDRLRVRDLVYKHVGPDRWMCQCPAHDDRTPSLSLREAADGQALIHCFAGCAPVEIVRALDLELRDLFSVWDQRADDPTRTTPPMTGAERAGKLPGFWPKTRDSA